MMCGGGIWRITGVPAGAAGTSPDHWAAPPQAWQFAPLIDFNFSLWFSFWGQAQEDREDGRSLYAGSGGMHRAMVRMMSVFLDQRMPFTTLVMCFIFSKRPLLLKNSIDQKGYLDFRTKASVDCRTESPTLGPSKFHSLWVLK